MTKSMKEVVLESTAGPRLNGTLSADALNL